MLQRKDIRIRLLQARTEANILEQELHCFADRCKVAPGQIYSTNLIDGTPINKSLLDDMHTCMIGGAGEFSALDDYDWMQPTLDLINVMVQDGFPLFGSCWGHQLIARAEGGKVIHDVAKAELGCREITLTDAGKQDELMGKFPVTFFANMGHHDRVITLPDSAVELAFSESQPNQAFRLRGLPIYGTQFHSELDAASERERLITYRRFYLNALPSEDAFQQVMDELRETTEVDMLLSMFLDHFVLS